MVFISYAEEDRPIVEKLTNPIKKAGFKCWRYDRNAYTGVSHFSAEADGIRNCSAFLLLISKHSMHSQEVDGELVLAHLLGKPIVPVLVGITWPQLVNERAEWVIILRGASSLTWSAGKDSSFNDKLRSGLSFLGLEHRNGESAKDGKHPRRAVKSRVTSPAYKPTGRERRFGVFIHYDLEFGETSEENSMDRMVKRLEYLTEILSPAGPGEWQGRAFVFVDMGWTQIARGNIQMQPAVEIARWVGELQGRIRHIDKVIKLVGISELVDFKNSLKSMVTKEVQDLLDHYLAGGDGPMRYDAPKVIDGIIRIANIGHHAPIFRFDDDVIFSGANARGEVRRLAIDQFKTNIARLCNHFDLLTQEPDVGYFVFSGHYTAKHSDALDRAVNGHATRVLQLCKFEPSRHVADLSNPWENVPKDQVELDCSVAEEFLKRIFKYGAPSDKQVISGAGLCLSDGAILDLPPFSNMRQNVVWIDDHLKYALHHELRHFGFVYGTKQRARVSDAVFSQNRYMHKDSASQPAFTLCDVAWHLQIYLPRLVLGCVADAFLRADSCLKDRFSDKKKFDWAMKKFVPSVYANALANHRGGKLSETWRLELGGKLWGVAETRLNEIVDFFSGFHGTFLAAWTDGKLGSATDFVPMAKPSFRDAVLNLGDSPHFTSRWTPCAGDLRTCIRVLIEDFLDYIEYTYYWREIAYTVRTQIPRSRLPGLRQPPLPFQLI